MVEKKFRFLGLEFVFRGVKATDVNSFDVEEIKSIANQLLSACLGDYAHRIWPIIEDEVVDDVLKNCQDEFTSDDVALAIGREISKRLGFEEV